MAVKDFEQKKVFGGKGLLAKTELTAGKEFPDEERDFPIEGDISTKNRDFS